MEIDIKQAGEVGFFVMFSLLLAIVLNVFYPNDFSIFTSDILVNTLEVDETTIGGWIAILTAGAAVGFFTSGNSFQVAIVGLVLGFCVYLYPIFIYMGDVFTLGMFNYPAYDIHKDTPIVLLLLIAIPSSALMFYLLFDLITSAIHSSSGGD